MELVVAAVGGAAGARDEAALLESVDERDDPAGHGTDPVSESPLTQAGCPTYQPQNRCLTRRQPQLLAPSGEPFAHVSAQLGEQEGDAWGRPMLVGGGAHGTKIAP